MIKKIKEILSDYTDYPVGQMTEDSDLIADLGLDSIDVINIVTSFEEEFGIEVPDRYIKDLTTIGKIRQFIEKTIQVTDAEGEE